MANQLGSYIPSTTVVTTGDVWALWHSMPMISNWLLCQTNEKSLSHSYSRLPVMTGIWRTQVRLHTIVWYY